MGFSVNNHISDSDYDETPFRVSDKPMRTLPRVTPEQLAESDADWDNPRSLAQRRQEMRPDQGLNLQQFGEFWDNVVRQKRRPRASKEWYAAKKQIQAPAKSKPGNSKRLGIQM
jgi:hypothetical protein